LWWFLAWLTFQPWRWRRCVPSKRKALSEIYGVTSQHDHVRSAKFVWMSSDSQSVLRIIANILQIQQNFFSSQNKMSVTDNTTHKYADLWRTNNVWRHYCTLERAYGCLPLELVYTCMRHFIMYKSPCADLLWEEITTKQNMALRANCGIPLNNRNVIWNELCGTEL
jgi:hypothetical protein